MKHPDKYIAKRYDTFNNDRRFTDIIYSGPSAPAETLRREMRRVEQSRDLPDPVYIPLVGEMHGHTCLSDGGPDPDTYFRNIRDLAKLDFAALTDHDHGGVGKEELWGGEPSKWEQIRRAVLAHRVEGQFSTLMAYERNSYPFYNNMVLYYRDALTAQPYRGSYDGEITAEELRVLLAREDVVVCPHDTYLLSSGGDLSVIPVELLTPYIEIMSRGDAAEYMGNPAWGMQSTCGEGGFWQDALRRGAKMGVIGGSDDHNGMNGRANPDLPYPWTHPGVTGVWATENSPEAIFDALKAGRTFAFMMGNPEGDMGGRMTLDFRLDGHYVGETIPRSEDIDLHVYLHVRADTPIRQITLVKNCRDYICFYPGGCEHVDSILDYKQETPCDCYYLRVELTDGRFGWTSPIWVEAPKGTLCT